MKHLLLKLLVLVILVAASACNVDNITGGSDGSAPQNVVTSTPAPEAPVAQRPTYTVQRGNVEENYEFTGRWQPRDQLSLSFQTGGSVRQVNVRRGDAVSAGLLLADLQIDDLENQLASAEITLESALAAQETGLDTDVQSVEDAEIQLANARLQLTSTKANSPWTSTASAREALEIAQRNLYEAERSYYDAISRADASPQSTDGAYTALQSARDSLRNAELNYFSAAQSFNNHQFSVKQQENSVLQAELALERARQRQSSGASDDDSVQSAQLNIDQIKDKIAKSSLYAPIDGVILDVTITPGDNIEAFNTVITIGIPEPKEVIASLSFGDTQSLSVGMVGICQVVNQPETAVGCAVRSIPLSSRDADQTTRVAASLENITDNQLVEVRMALQVRESVLWLPPAAIRTFQNRTFVVLETPDGPRTVDIEIGLETDERVEIISGVNEGDVVIAP